MIEQIKNWVDENKELIKSTYHHFHCNAEISWKEKETTDYLCKQFEYLTLELLDIGEMKNLVQPLELEQTLMRYGSWSTVNGKPIIPVVMMLI